MPAAAKPTTPAACLAALPEPRRGELKSLHAAIRKAAPRLTPHFAQLLDNGSADFAL
jgi:hypothetical protein